MEIKEKVKAGYEGSVKRLEDFVENKGLGSSRLKKAKKTQHKVNLAVFAASMMSVAGATFWAFNRNHRH